MKKVIVTTPSRLAFTLIDLNGSIGRINGGVGLALCQPNFQLEVEKSNDIEILAAIDIEATHLERAKRILEKLKDKYQFKGVKLNIRSSILSHNGLGSGTQLSLALMRAVCKLYEIDFDLKSAALFVGRGGTSGIGVAAFDKGGFIADGGHKYPAQKSSFLPSSASAGISPPPILLRRDFPDWKVLLVIPKCKQISGEEEVRLFSSLCPLPRDEAEKLSHLILMKLLPALVEEDLPSFSEAINEIQDIGWKKIEVATQGEIIKKTMAFLRENGALGVGLSSWGPAIYAFGEEEELSQLKSKTEEFLNHLPEGGICYLTRANNKGAEVTIT